MFSSLHSRMVSIYGYNRFGDSESFPAFLRRWKRLMRHYIEKGEKEEWYTPCHLLPMFEYTHHDGKLKSAFTDDQFASYHNAKMNKV